MFLSRSLTSKSSSPIIHFSYHLTKSVPASKSFKNQDLKQTLDSVNVKVNPKKKFSFKNKSTKKSDSNVSSVEGNVGELNGRFGLSNAVSKTHIVDFSIVEGKGNSCSRVFELPGFRGKQNEVLEKDFGGNMEAESVGEFCLSDLSDCDVKLKGCLRELFMNKLKNCKVYVGPVFGSVLIEEAVDCVFVLASHQIRIHHAKRSNFYLRVRTMFNKLWF